MIEFLIICLLIIFLFNKILKHNLFVSDFKIKVKILGLDIQLSIKEKKHPS